MFGFGRAERAKRDNRIEDVIRSGGVELKPVSGDEDNLTGLCPFHDDKTPSLSVTPSKGLWNCFAGCGGGTVIDWVVKADNASSKDAIDFLLSEKQGSEKPDSGVGDQGSEEKQKDITNPDSCTLLKEICQIYQNNFKTNQKAQRYLKTRGITNPALWSLYRIGYCDGSRVKHLIPQTGPLTDQLKELGILNNKNNESFYKCVTFPITDLNGRLSGLYGRSIEGARQIYLKGPHSGVWNQTGINGHDRVYITESIIDALSLVQLGIPNVIPIYGVNGLTPAHIILLETKPLKEIYLVLDNDAPGRKAVHNISKKLRHLRIPIYSVTLPEGTKDPNDLLKQGRTKEQFEKTVSTATLITLNSKEALPEIELQPATKKPAITEKEPAQPAAPVHPDPPHTESTNGLIDYKKNEAWFKYSGLIYQVRGLNLKTVASIKVVVTVNSDEGSHTDRLDLYVSKSRRAFSNIVAGKLDYQSVRIEDDLLKIISEIEGLQLEQNEKRDTHKKHRPYRMTEPEKQEALTLLKDKNILNRIVTDLDICGYVGEDTNKQICYLSATSKITSNPISIIIRSSSAAGKSNLMEKIALLIPPEKVEYFSRITPQALYYMEPDQLDHKLLIIDEKAGSEDADYSIRGLQSSGKLILAVVIKDPSTGKSKTTKLEIIARSPLWESTTNVIINQENASRCFELWLDESLEQTQRIHKSQKEAFTQDGWKREKQRAGIINTHRNVQRLLKNRRIEIPYQEKLSFPVIWMRTRRDHNRFLALIGIIALLHQYQREIKISPDGDEYIESTIDDYEIAYKLALKVLKVTLSPMSKLAQDTHKFLFEMILHNARKAGIENQEYLFTRRELIEFTAWSEPKVRRGLKELVCMEYVEIINASGGRGGYKYQLTVFPQDTGKGIEGLTTPDELRNKIT